MFSKKKILISIFFIFFINLFILNSNLAKTTTYLYKLLTPRLYDPNVQKTFLVPELFYLLKPNQFGYEFNELLAKQNNLEDCSFSKGIHWSFNVKIWPDKTIISNKNQDFFVSIQLPNDRAVNKCKKLVELVVDEIVTFKIKDIVKDLKYTKNYYKNIHSEKETDLLTFKINEFLKLTQQKTNLSLIKKNDFFISNLIKLNIAIIITILVFLFIQKELIRIVKYISKIKFLVKDKK